MFKELSENYNGSLKDFLPAAPITDRNAWDGLPSALKEELIQKGESLLGFSYPCATACDYLDFTRTGNRERFQEKIFTKRIVLNQLILAECAENKGRFLDDILNGIYSICEESAWQLPAHNSYIRDTPQLPLPDVTRPVIDLFSAETASVLAVAEYVLREPLSKISPFISVMIFDELNRRIFVPYLKEHFWWMGDGKSHMNNWTSWCTQNVLLAAFTQPVEEEIRRQIFKKACVSLDYFLDEYGDDGCCDEGAQYYRHAGLTLFGAMEVLNSAAPGLFSPLYETEKIKNIASYIQNVHVDDIYYVNFADCSPVAGRCGAREYLFGKRTGNNALMAFAAEDFKRSSDKLILEEHNLFHRLLQVFAYEEMENLTVSSKPAAKDIYYPSAGLFIARDKTFCLAVKGGDNDDSHNHNDTGSFTVYKNGQPMFIDLGVETYTKKTFSPERYDIWTMQSRYHNLPTFDGVMQKDGSSYQAELKNYSFDDSRAAISMDIAGAYPSEQIKVYERNVELKKQTPDSCSEIRIHDHYEGSLQPAVLSLMVYEEPAVCGDTISIGTLGTVKISGASSIRTERLPITDARLKLAWKHDVYRILAAMEASDLELCIL